MIDIKLINKEGERHYVKVSDPMAETLKKEIAQRNDIKAERLKRMLNMPDLTRIENSPVKFIVEKILAMSEFKDFDVVEFDEIVSVRNNFDILNAATDHPSRRETDTYYVNEDHVLRTQTTTMWTFCNDIKEIKEKFDKTGKISYLSFGKCYRKDEIDRSHFPVFHQIDGWYICKKTEKEMGIKDLENVLVAIAKNLYGEDIKYRVSDDTFPFTHPSLQMEILVNDNWLEILGAGMVHNQVLKNLNIDPEIYNGWAFGFGIERLAMINSNIPDIRVFWSNDPRITSQFKDINSKYVEVSKYPMTYRDISFIIDKNVNLNNYYEIVRDCSSDLIEEVKLLDKYDNEEKFGKDKISYTFRIVYRSAERTLTNEEVDKIQDNIIEKTKQELSAIIR